MARRIILVLLLASSCYKVPDHLLQEIPQEFNLANSIDEALKSPEFQEGPWPEANWWEWFSDEQLTQLIDEGLKNSPDLKRAEARLQESLNFADQIRAKLFPHLRFFFQENYEHLSAHGIVRQFAFHAPPTVPPPLAGVNFDSLATPVPAILNVLDLGFRMDWDLDFFGKKRYQWAAAIGEARAMEAEARQTRLVLSSQIAQAYFSLQTHAALLKIYKEVVLLRKQLQNLIEKREKIGLDTKFETIASEIDLSTVEKVVYDLEQSVSLDQHRLFVLIGMSPDTNREIELSFRPPLNQISIPKSISSNLLARRPNLMAEIWRVEKRASDIGVAKAQFYPEINLQGLLSLRSVFPDQLFSLSSAENSLLPSFSLPIFQGGELKANLREKLNLFEESVHSYHQTLLNALQEIADLLKQIDSTRKQLDAQQNILRGTEMRKYLKNRQFKVGVANYLSVLEFDITTLTEKISLINLQSDQILLAVKLMQALGGGYQSPLEVPEKFTEGCNVRE